MRQYMAWLALNYEVPLPRELDHYVAYLNARLSKLCTRGALKNVHTSFMFMEGLSRLPEEEKQTSTNMFHVMYKEVLFPAAPSRFSKQAPRMFAVMIGALEVLFTDAEMPPYFRISAW